MQLPAIIVRLRILHASMQYLVSGTCVLPQMVASTDCLEISVFRVFEVVLVLMVLFNERITHTNIVEFYISIVAV